MAFTPEDGSGVAGANSYQTVDEFKDYCGDRGYDITGYTDPEIEIAGIQATDYADKRWTNRYRGYKQASAQGLEWPRSDAFDDNDFLLQQRPKALMNGISEYMWLVLQLNRDLAPVPAPSFPIQDPATGEVADGSGGLVTEKKEVVGPIEESTKYADGNSTGKPMVGTGNMTQQIPEYPQADLWIEQILVSYASRGLYRG